MTANKIKEAALRLFAHKGYEGTALSEIAKIVGIKTPSIYAHYPSKEELFLSIYQDLVTFEMKTIEKVIKTETELYAGEKLKAIFYELTDLFERKEEKLFFKRAVFFPPSDLKQKLQEEFKDCEKKSTEKLRNLFENGMKTGEIKQLNPEDLVASYYCILDGLLMEHHYYDKNEYEKRREAIWTIFWQGISVKKEN